MTHWKLAQSRTYSYHFTQIQENSLLRWTIQSGRQPLELVLLQMVWMQPIWDMRKSSNSTILTNGWKTTQIQWLSFPSTATLNMKRLCLTAWWKMRRSDRTKKKKRDEKDLSKKLHSLFLNLAMKKSMTRSGSRSLTHRNKLKLMNL